MQILLNPPSLQYLAQSILSAVLAGYLVTRSRRGSTTRLLAHFFVAMTVGIALLFLDQVVVARGAKVYMDAAPLVFQAAGAFPAVLRLPLPGGSAGPRSALGCPRGLARGPDRHRPGGAESRAVLARHPQSATAVSPATCPGLARGPVGRRRSGAPSRRGAGTQPARAGRARQLRGARDPPVGPGCHHLAGQSGHRAARGGSGVADHGVPPVSSSRSWSSIWNASPEPSRTHGQARGALARIHAARAGAGGGGPHASGDKFARPAAPPGAAPGAAHAGVAGGRTRALPAHSAGESEPPAGRPAGWGQARRERGPRRRGPGPDPGRDRPSRHVIQRHGARGPRRGGDARAHGGDGAGTGHRATHSEEPAARVPAARGQGSRRPPDSFLPRP